MCKNPNAINGIPHLFQASCLPASNILHLGFLPCYSFLCHLFIICSRIFKGRFISLRSTFFNLFGHLILNMPN